MVKQLHRATSETIQISIYIAGDINCIRDSCREYCFREGLCVSVVMNEYIYTGGSESGAVIGLVNYPRFPTSLESLRIHADKLASQLLNDCCQDSVLIVDPVKTLWVTRRVKGQ